MEIILTKFVYNCQINVLFVFRSMGSMVFAHRKQFLLMYKVADLFSKRFNKVMEEIRQHALDRMQLRFLWKCTNVGTLGMFYKLRKRANKIAKTSDFSENVENEFYEVKEHAYYSIKQRAFEVLMAKYYRRLATVTCQGMDRVVE